MPMIAMTIVVTIAMTVVTMIAMTMGVIVTIATMIVTFSHETTVGTTMTVATIISGHTDINRTTTLAGHTMNMDIPTGTTMASVVH
jgi:hypothetical protein